MKKIIVAISILLLAIVAGVFVYLSTMDWSEYKGTIAKQFYELTGKKLIFEGPVSLNVFPETTLNASRVKIAKQTPHKLETLATIENVAVDVSLKALLNKNLEVRHMSLINAQFFFEKTPGKPFNWYSPLTDAQTAKLNEMDMSFDSVTLENAKVKYVYTEEGDFVEFNNINMELIAESFFGPYNLDGSFLEKGSQRGVNLSVGALSSDMQAPVKVVLAYPDFATSLQFDGDVSFKKAMLKADVKVESKGFVNWINSYLKDEKINEAYNYPLILTTGIEVNNKEFKLSNLAAQYGKTLGAGTLYVNLVPDTEMKKNVQFDFQMTDFDLMPIKEFVVEFVNKYKNKNYLPVMDYKVTASLMANKAIYDQEQFNDVKIDAMYDVGNLNISNISATMPDKSEISMSGQVFSYENLLSYVADIDVSTPNMLNIINKFGINVKPLSKSAYKEFMASLYFQGNVNNLKVDAKDIKFDKTKATAKADFALTETPNVMITVNADEVNFDNYIPDLTEGQKFNNWREQVKFWLAKLDFLQKINGNVAVNLGSAIYKGVPFDNTELKLDVLPNNLNVRALNVENLLNTKIALVGETENYLQDPLFKDVKLNLNISDYAKLAEKFMFETPKIDMTNYNQIALDVTLNGVLTDFDTVLKLKSADVGFTYNGKVLESQDGRHLDGNMTLKAKDFSRLLKDLRVEYASNADVLGLLNFDAHVTGTENKFTLTEAKVNLGVDSASGKLLVDNSAGKPKITAEIVSENLDMSKFIHTIKTAKSTK